MYEFRDLTPVETGTVKGRMPESISFNGVWIEDEIPEFIVTGTTGRELTEAELDTFEVGFLMALNFARSGILQERSLSIT